MSADSPAVSDAALCRQVGEFVIRPADAEHGADYLAFVTAVLAEFGLRSEPDGVDADLLDITGHYRASGGEFWAVWREGQLLGTGGFIMTSPGQAELRKMYLSPAVRGRGLGRMLLELIETVAQSRGALRMTLETASVLHDAIRLYERNGYQPSCGLASASRCDRRFTKTLAPRSRNHNV